MSMTATTKPRLLWDLSTDEKYANPGNPVKRQLRERIRR